MKQTLNVPQVEEPSEEISPAADAAMLKLVELFSDPAMVARAHFRAPPKDQPNSTFSSSQSSMTSLAMSQTVKLKIGSGAYTASA
jgi:hypothetical protein